MNHQYYTNSTIRLPWQSNNLTPALATEELAKAVEMNPGEWADHSRLTGEACRRIAERCSHLDSDFAYCIGVLHDIGRRVGRCYERHLTEGYHRCMELGWEKMAQICITHSFVIQDMSFTIGRFDGTPEDYKQMKSIVETARYDDYDLLVQLCDALALPTGFCLLEKRFVDVALRYGAPAATVPRWKRTIEIKQHFEQLTDCSSIYDLLPNVAENSLK